MAKFSIKSRRGSLLSRKKLIFLVLLLLVLLGIWIAAKAIKGPAVGEVYRPSQGISNITPIYIEQDGKNIVFNYPEEYQKDTEGKTQPTVLEYYTYRKSGGQRPGNLALAVSVSTLTGKLEEDGAFRTRKEQSAIYQSRISSVNNYVFTIFKKKDGSETTAFTTNKDKMATISMSGNLATNNQSEAEFTAILNSWQWK